MLTNISRLNGPLAALISLALLAGCGNNENNLGSSKQPKLNIEQPDSNGVQLRLPRQPGNPEEQQKLLLKNTGDTTLKITEITWVSRPPELHARKSLQDVDSCASCGSAVCLPAALKCVETGLPDTPWEIAENQSEELIFYVQAGTTELSCPTPGADVPEEYRDLYCGELLIKTNANNDVDGRVSGGAATLYFLKDNASGSLRLPTSFIQFNGVTANSTDTRMFSIENASTTEPLTISSISVDGMPQYLKVNGDMNTEIAPGQSKQYTLLLTLPEGLTEEQMNFNTTLTVNSSDSQALSDKITVSVKTGLGATAAIDIDKKTLKFDGAASQELTITNVGGATLTVNSFDFEPRSAADFYTIELNGAPVSGNENIQKPIDGMPDANKRVYTIKFNRPAGNTDPSVAQLLIRHNDDATGKESRVTLLGDEGDVPFGIITPNVFSASANASGPREMTFAVTNLGTAPLVLNGVMLNAQQGSTDEFQVNMPIPTTVAPGAMAQGVFLFTPANTDADNVSATITSNAINESELFITASAASIPDNQPAPAIKPSFTEKAKVGELTTLTAEGSSPAADNSNAQWVLLARPASSTLELNRFGAEAAFKPDVAGNYKVGLILTDSGLSAQATIDFEAVP